ncbi:MAG TPA: zf-HC2 domain-containing protein [Streptosporangiaceae bacterium]|nr:zf-HC2 domain-containing protein [Streptosporangiaceae bacterium]
MSHNPEAWAAAYLGGAMSPSRRQSFEAHLLGCDDCWQEVQLARQGRLLAEEARELSPPGLRDRIRAAVTAAAEHTAGAPGTGRRPAALRGLPLLAVAAAVAAVVAGTALSGSAPPGAQPGGLLAAAVRDYAAGRLPGSPLPRRLVPDLAALGLRPVGEGIGRLGGRQLVAIDYRDARGRRIAVYLTSADIPPPPGATRLHVAGMGWTATVSGVHLLCVNTVLVAGRDPALLGAVARILNLT